MAAKAEMKAPAKSRKIESMMGVSPTQLFADSLTASRDGTLQWMEFGIFWGKVRRDKASATAVLVDAATKLLKVVTESKGTPEYPEHLLNTIAYITLYIPFNPTDSSLKTFEKNWKAKEASIRDWPQAIEVFRTLFMAMAPPPEGIMGPLIIGCSTLHSVKEYQRLSDPLSYPTTDEADITGAESCFFFSHLKTMASEGETKLILVLTNTMNKMLTLAAQMKMNPKVAETTLLALLHMFRQFMSTAPVTDALFLKRVMMTIQQFYLWPCPYGNVTRELLQLMHLERICPGAALRMRLIEDSRAADYLQCDVKDPNDHLRKSSVYYIMDSSPSTSTVSYVQGLDITEFNPEEKKGGVPAKRAPIGPSGTTLSPTTQAVCVLNMLKNDVDIKADEFELFKTLTNEDVALLYSKMQAAIATIRDPDTAKEQRTRLFTPIKAEIKTLAAASKGKPAVKLPVGFAAPFCPSPPATRHQALLCPTTYAFTAKEDLGFMSLSTLPYPGSPFFTAFEALLNRYTTGTPPAPAKGAPSKTPAAAPTPTAGAAGAGAAAAAAAAAAALMPDEEKDLGRGRVGVVGGNGAGNGDAELRIIIAGGDLLLHNFLCAYLVILQSQPHLLSGLKLRFFLVPTESNGAAGFLARHDSWYNRHVYVPFRSHSFLVPWLRTDVLDDVERSLEPPGVFLRSLVDSYVREAAVTCHFNVYKVQGWTRAAEGKGDMRESVPCDQLIPFIQRLEVGLEPALHLFREKVEKGKPEKKFDDILRDRQFTWATPPELLVKITQMDLAGNKLATLSDDPAVYESLLMANVPRKSDQCFPADPLSPWLEMYVRAHRTYQKQPTRKNFLLTDQKQHVSTVDISCITPTGSFYVLADGQRFGPYHRIRLSPIIEEGTAKPFTFPIQTFFPLDV